MMRLGRFHLDEKLLRQGTDLARPIFKDMVVMDVIRHFDLMATEYIAEGPMFDVIEEGRRAPLYTVHINNGQPIFERIED